MSKIVNNNKKIIKKFYKKNIQQELQIVKIKVKVTIYNFIMINKSKNFPQKRILIKKIRCLMIVIS